MDKAKTHLSVWYEIFAPDNGNGTTYIADRPTFEQAKQIAGDKYCVDVIVELCTEDGESILESGDRLFTAQVYPEYKSYNNHDRQPVILLDLLEQIKGE